jgi:pimeloyl-ACP methyl ester carboxylesterase
MDEDHLRRRIATATRRSWHPPGNVRQLTAVAADSRRAGELPRIKAPTLVVHGRDDPLVPLACGSDTARRIPGSRLVAVPGMGHDIVPGVVDHLLASLVPHLQSVEAA